MTDHAHLLRAAEDPDHSGPVITGASKEFFRTADPSVLRVKFKDVVHGRGLEQEVPGTGRLREEFCFWFYRLLEREGIRTHVATRIAGIALADGEPLLADGILVRKMDMLALELIARYVARGHWVDPHKCPVLPAGVALEEPVTEFCLKWKAEVENLDYQTLPGWAKCLHAVLGRTPLRALLVPKTTVRDDPRVNADVAIALHRHATSERIRGHLIASREEADRLRELTLRVNGLLRDFLACHGWVLEDGKFEVGIPVGHSGRDFFVGDEYTQDSSRVRDGAGNSLTKDLHRNRKGPTEIYDGYARLTEAIKSYAR